MFQMLLKILAFSEFVRNVNSSPLPVLYQSENDTTHQWENDTTHQWGNYTTHQWGNDTTPKINAETEIGLHQTSSEDYYYSTPATVEGDILLNDDRNAVDNIWTQRVEEGVDGSISISVPIAYEIEAKLLKTHGTMIAQAMKMISDVTCVTFHEKKEGDDNYLVFTYHKHGCASYIGCIGGPQVVYIGPHCLKGNVCHEIIHALGLNHEQTRSDHGEHIKIVYPNIIPKMKKNFIPIHANMLNSKYDTCSIMHYGSNYFSANGLPTIMEITSGDCGGLKMGQRTDLTKDDIEKLHRLYNCDGNVEEMANSVPAWY